MSLNNSPIDFPASFEEEEFFVDEDGLRTLVRPEDIEKQIPQSDQKYLSVEEAYWLNPPYAFALICHDSEDNQIQYYVIEPHLTGTEKTLLKALDEQLRQEIDYENIPTSSTGEELTNLIQVNLIRLLRRLGLVDKEMFSQIGLEDTDDDVLDAEDASLSAKVINYLAKTFRQRIESQEQTDREDAPVPVERGALGQSLDPHQIDKLTYYLIRNYVGYGKIDPFKYDINVEDISCDGYNEPVFVHHTEYGQVLTNVHFAESNLDKTVKQLAQNTGKGISKRQPQVDTTLQDGSRAQLTLGKETTTKGSNFTIRQFKDIPFTPIDLITWRTYSLEQMAFLWLSVENGKAGIFAGGTASGKTTTLNAVSLFVKSTEKIVSIEDTPELELPQRNWVQSVTRETTGQDDTDDIGEYDLLETALRQRPEYIIMGEIRGEEGKAMFQANSTGHTSYSTFHADTAEQVRNRMTNDPINVNKTLFAEMDLLTIQREVTLDGDTVRRTPYITEVVGFDDEQEKIIMENLWEWNAQTDTYELTGEGSLIEQSSTLQDLKHERGWDDQRLQNELDKRKAVLAYLINNGINSYGGVGGVLQGFMADEEVILSLIAKGELEDYVANLRTMKTVDIDIDPEREGLMPRPDPDEKLLSETDRVLDDTHALINEYRDHSIADSFATTSSSQSDNASRGVDVEFGDNQEQPTQQADANPFASGTDRVSATVAAETDGEKGSLDDLFADDGDDAKTTADETAGDTESSDEPQEAPYTPETAKDTDETQETAEPEESDRSEDADESEETAETQLLDEPEEPADAHEGAETPEAAETNLIEETEESDEGQDTVDDDSEPATEDEPTNTADEQPDLGNTVRRETVIPEHTGREADEEEESVDPESEDDQPVDSDESVEESPTRVEVSAGSSGSSFVPDEGDENAGSESGDSTDSPKSEDVTTPPTDADANGAEPTDQVPEADGSVSPEDASNADPVDEIPPSPFASDDSGDEDASDAEESDGEDVSDADIEELREELADGVESDSEDQQ